MKTFESVKKLCLIFSCIVLFPAIANSQDTTGLSKLVDLKDVLHDWFGSKDKPRTVETTPPVGKTIYSFLPGVSYNNTTGFLIGFNLAMSRLNGNPQTTTMSAAVLSSNYTSKNQFNVKFKTDLFFSDDNWYIGGDWRFSITSQPTYGLGTGDLDTEDETVYFDLIRFYEKVSKRVYGRLYLGGEFYFDRYTNITTENDDKKYIYPNYHNQYNQIYNYDTTAYSNVGFGALVEFDSRDNINNPYKGIYTNLKYIWYGKVLGGDVSAQQIDVEFRTYLSFGGITKHVFALWLYGKSNVQGTPPYLCLPAIGWDKYEKSGRGYTLGRYRGNDLAYGEFEYRFPITRNGLFGGVAFVNLTTASDIVTDEKLFEFIRPAYGVGLRIKFDKVSRTNIDIDFGKGSDGSTSVSLNLAETF